MLDMNRNFQKNAECRSQVSEYRNNVYLPMKLRMPVMKVKGWGGQPGT